MNAIECDDVSIRYITGDFKSIGLKEYIMRRLTHNFHVQEFWADRHVTFTVEKGDMLGIIGSNGAGKSTLLKAVTGIMIPTGGTIKTNGRMAALLELASGFDAHMTVRENTYLRGAMLGYTKDFLDEKYDEIIAFAELEEFQEHMFKQLSSGMKSRLAFSVACLVNPDILILDEVLSVGDGAFRKKSGDKMMQILNSGTTGVLVSHSIGQIRELCNKVLWLDHGNQIAFSDDVQLYCDAYDQFLMTKELPQNEDDVRKLADGFLIRQQEQRKKNEEKETQRLEKIIEEGHSDAAINAAIRVLQKGRPEALADQYR